MVGRKCSPVSNFVAIRARMCNYMPFEKMGLITYACPTSLSAKVILGIFSNISHGDINPQTAGIPLQRYISLKTSHTPIMTSSKGNISALLALCEGNSSVTGEFPSQRPVTRSFDVFIDRRLNKRLSKQSRRRWIQTPSRSLWRHCNAAE